MRSAPLSNLFFLVCFLTLGTGNDYQTKDKKKDENLNFICILTFETADGRQK
jgi:hypothetical protein